MFEGLDGNSFSTSELRGKPVVIVIAATWCPPCKREAPALEKAYLEYKDKGVVFIGVFAVSSEKAIKKFVKKYGITFPVGKGDGIKEQFGWKSFPKTAFVDAKGIVRGMHAGEIKYKQLVEGIEEIME
jgi:thiol-disulfide isomerase/thioredoxin